MPFSRTGLRHMLWILERLLFDPGGGARDFRDIVRPAGKGDGPQYGGEARPTATRPRSGVDRSPRSAAQPNSCRMQRCSRARLVAASARASDCPLQSCLGAHETGSIESKIVTALLGSSAPAGNLSELARTILYVAHRLDWACRSTRTFVPRKSTLNLQRRAAAVQCFVGNRSHRIGRS